MEDGSGDQSGADASPPIAAVVYGTHDGGMPAAQDAQTTAMSLAGSVRIGAHSVRYRLDRSQAWSYLHPRYSFLARPTGKVIRVYPTAPRATEKVLPTPWGKLLVVLWELGPDLDLVGGREALGGPSPNPWRPFLFTDRPEVAVDAGDRGGSPAGPLQVRRIGQQVSGKVILFPRSPT